jgi:hypothetical protein
LIGKDPLSVIFDDNDLYFPADAFDGLEQPPLLGLRDENDLGIRVFSHILELRRLGLQVQRGDHES